MADKENRQKTNESLNQLIIKTNQVFCFFFLAAGKSTLFRMSL